MAVEITKDSLQVHLKQLRDSLDVIQKSGKVTYWRMSFAENLYARAGEYILVDLFLEANETCNRLERWINRHLPKVHQQKKRMQPIVAFDALYLKGVLQDIKTTLEKKRRLIPIPERESALRHLEILKKMLESKDLRRLHEETLSLRASLIARLRRSYRARSALLPLKHVFKEKTPLPTSEMIGLYNSQKTLENAFSLVGERDPIWVEDFLEIYSELFRYVETLSSKK